MILDIIDESIDKTICKNSADIQTLLLVKNICLKIFI